MSHYCTHISDRTLARSLSSTSGNECRRDPDRDRNRDLNQRLRETLCDRAVEYVMLLSERPDRRALATFIIELTRSAGSLYPSPSNTVPAIHASTMRSSSCTSIPRQSGPRSWREAPFGMLLRPETAGRKKACQSRRIHKSDIRELPPDSLARHGRDFPAPVTPRLSACRSRTDRFRDHHRS